MIRLKYTPDIKDMVIRLVLGFEKDDPSAWVVIHSYCTWS